VSTVRRFRKSHAIRDSLPLAVRVVPDEPDRAVAEELRREIQRMAMISTLELLTEAPDPTGCARLKAGGSDVLIPLAGVMEPDVERARLKKRLAEIEHASTRSRTKLSTEGFVAKADAAVVEKERVRLEALKEEAAAVASQLEELG
jgi:valyl-tRNA synthetase